MVWNIEKEKKKESVDGMAVLSVAITRLYDEMTDEAIGTDMKEAEFKETILKSLASKVDDMDEDDVEDILDSYETE